MKTLLIVVMTIIVAFAVYVPVVTAASWFDDFESYATPDAFRGYPIGNLASPWVTGTSGTPLQVIDFTMPPAPADKTATFIFSNASDPKVGTSFRAIGHPLSAGSAYARIRVEEYGHTRFGVYTDTGSYVYGQNRDKDLAEFCLDNFFNESTRFRGATVYDNGVQVASQALPMNLYDWYDVRISWTADRRVITFEYKTVTDPPTETWTLATQYTAANPMDFNYVGLGLGVYDIGNTCSNVGYDDPNGSISGKVTLADYSGDLQYAMVKVEFRNPGDPNPVDTRAVVLDSLGNYRLDSVLAGTYDLAFKAATLLQKSVTVTVGYQEDKTGVDVTLTNGDTDGNNTVNKSDLSSVIKNLDSLGDR
jgi:hypothetical protein